MGPSLPANRTLLVVFRWGIFLLACMFLYVRLAGTKGIVATSGPGLLAALRIHLPLFFVVGGLMLLNWLLEAVKWEQLVRQVERVGLRQAFIATIAGTSVGFVSVNRTGDFLGRVLFLAPSNRVAGSFATALGSIAQFVVTLVAGGSALVLHTMATVPSPWLTGWFTWALAMLTALVSCIALVLYFSPGHLRQLILLLPFLHRFERASGVLTRYQRSDLLTVLLLSAARYLVFGAQYVLLLHSFIPDIAIPSLMLGVPLVYLIATLIPSIMLTELGVRGSVAVAVFAPFGADAALVLLATTCLWVINVALPASVGSLLLLFARIRTAAPE